MQYNKHIEVLFEAISHDYQGFAFLQTSGSWISRLPSKSTDSWYPTTGSVTWGLLVVYSNTFNIDICVPSLMCLWYATSTEALTKYNYISEITLNAPSRTCQSLGVYTF